MENKFTIVFDSFSREYVPVVSALFVAAGIGRVLEVILVSTRHGFEIFKMGHLYAAVAIDLQLVVLLSLPLTLFYFLMKGTGQTVRTLMLSIIAGVAAVTGFLLSFYYSSTLTPLGPEVWAYSISEMTDTVIAAENSLGLKLMLVLSFMILLVAFIYWSAKRVTELSNSVRKTLIAALIITTATGTLLLPFLNRDTGDLSSNKLSYFITTGFEHSAIEAVEYEPIKDSEYPFLKRSSAGDVLGPFFKELTEPPNIVFILVESLGGEFVGKTGQWTGFAPFIDSLAVNGLYWENGLSMSGRTFGMIPSLLGSLPPGNNGFMDLGPDYPVHTSLIRMLDEQGYHTSFYSGYNTYFDGLNYFLDYQGTDVIINKEWITSNFGDQFKTGANYWGYDDKSMLEIAGSVVDSLALRPDPRLEIYHTLQSHSPFTLPDEQFYARRFNEHLEELSLPISKQEAFERYRSELTTLLFTDDALRDFMNVYKKRDSYSNTLFIITGDHWLIPVPQTSRVSRYHVPIIFYSDLIEKPVQFQSVNTHANIVPALTTLIDSNTGLALPDSVHWIGETMDTLRTFRNIHSLPMMQNKNQLSDYISGNHFLSDNTLYRVEEGLILVQEPNSEVKNELEQALLRFKSKNSYVTENNKLYPEFFRDESSSDYEFITRFSVMFDEIDSNSLSVDEQFKAARDYAFESDYDRARAIAKRLLLEVPDYHDIRIFLGRTHAWNREYEKAREYLHEVQRRDSTYNDTYNALADTEYWSGNYSVALEVINTGLTFHPVNESFLQKKINILIALDRSGEAKITFTELKKAHPSNQNIDELENQLF